MTIRLLNVLMLAGFLATVAWVPTVGVALLARCRFENRLGEILAAVESDMRSGRLPAERPVLELRNDCDWMISNARRVRFSVALAHHFVHLRMGTEHPFPASYNNLPAPARARMHQLTRDIRRAMTSYLIFGSRVWWALAISRALAKHMPRLRPPQTPRSSAQIVDDARAEARRERRRDQRQGPQHTVVA